MRALLLMLGHEVRDTASSMDALKIVRTGWPECALLDIGLPDIEGYELVVGYALKIRRYT
jgi:CheY-like chemotaxis protein